MTTQTLEPATSSFTAEPLHPEFGAVIRGLSFETPFAPETVAAIRDAIDAYSFVVFPGAAKDDDRQMALTRALGEPEASHTKLGIEGRIDYFGTIGNVQDDGTVQGNDHPRTRFLLGNNMWHTDSSFRKVPTYVSIMSAYEVPAEGGATQFISQRAAYSRLPDATKAAIDPLIVVHDYVYSRTKAAPVKASHAFSLPPIANRLVRTNPANGAKNFYVGSHAKEIVGWNHQDSRDLIERLEAEATGAAHVYSHRWQPGELAIWDNRCLLHRGAGYDADKYRRYMRQTRVCGGGPTLNEPAAA